MAFRTPQRSISATVGSCRTWVGRSQSGEEPYAGIGGAEEEGISHQEWTAEQRIPHLGAHPVPLKRAEPSAQCLGVDLRYRMPECHGHP
jgi:hypothetical protein